MPTGNIPDVAALLLMPIDLKQMYAKACAICVLWVIDAKSHVAYGVTRYYVRKQTIIHNNPKCT